MVKKRVCLIFLVLFLLSCTTIAKDQLGGLEDAEKRILVEVLEKKMVELGELEIFVQTYGEEVIIEEEVISLKIEREAVEAFFFKYEAGFQANAPLKGNLHSLREACDFGLKQEEGKIALYKEILKLSRKEDIKQSVLTLESSSKQRIKKFTSCIEHNT